MKILCKWNEEAGVTESDAAVTHTVSLWKHTALFYPQLKSRKKTMKSLCLCCPHTAL